MDAEAVAGAVEQAELVDHAATVSQPAQMDDHAHRARGERGHRAEGQAGQSTERGKAGRHVGGTVRVHRGGAALMAGVQSDEQLDHLGAAELADDQPVRTHPQRLTHQLAQRDGARAFDVGGAGHQPHRVRVVEHDLGGVLDDHEPLGRRHQPEQRTEQRRLARTRAAGDDEREPRLHDRGKHLGNVVGHAAARGERVQRERLTRQHPQRQGRRRAQRRQHGMQARAVGEGGVDERLRVVESSAGRRGKALREPPHRGVVGEADVRPFQAVPAVEPHRVGRVDQDVADTR